MIITVAELSQVAQARRRVTEFASHAGASEPRLAQIAIVVTELATNLLKHAGGGEILAERFLDRDGSGIEVMALDRGPGMADIERCMRDGYSSAGSLGHGLGSVSRQANQMRIWSHPGHGTAVQARFTLHATENAHRLECGAALSVYPGESVCGDAWAFADTPAGPTLLVADGTGHGVEAARAANTAVDVFRKHAGEPCEALVHRLHRALVATRGAALAVARLDTDARMVRFVGVGNIAGTLITGGDLRHMVSNNGIAGHLSPRVREFTYGYGGEPLVILHSDGLATRWDLGGYPGLATRHPSLVAGILLRDFRRGRDDASVVALRALH